MTSTLSQDKPLTRQIPTPGVPAGVEQLFVGAILWAEPADAAAALNLVADDDIADPHLAKVVATVRLTIACGGHISPQLVMDRLTRQGVHPPVLKALLDATTSGAAAPALMDYAAAVVAAALRRHTADSGVALSDAATSMGEDDLAPLCAKINAKVRDTADRLRRLRGES